MEKTCRACSTPNNHAQPPQQHESPLESLRDLILETALVQQDLSQHLIPLALLDGDRFEIVDYGNFQNTIVGFNFISYVGRSFEAAHEAAEYLRQLGFDSMMVLDGRGMTCCGVLHSAPGLLNSDLSPTVPPQLIQCVQGFDWKRHHIMVPVESLPPWLRASVGCGEELIVNGTLLFDVLEDAQQYHDVIRANDYPPPLISSATLPRPLSCHVQANQMWLRDIYKMWGIIQFWEFLCQHPEWPDFQDAFREKFGKAMDDHIARLAAGQE